jgi:putative intracellular protease/amidase
MARVLIVLTSHATLGETGRATGFYFDEMAAPYYALLDAGHRVDIASIKGGAAVHDPGSIKPNPAERPAAVQRFLADPDAMAKLSATPAVDTVDPSRYDAVFLPGGHGTMYDFPTSAELATLVGRVYDRGGVIGAVCHGPAGLVNAKRADGEPLVAGLRVNSFTDAEEAAVGLTNAMPFLLERQLRQLGAKFEGAPNFTAKVVRDGRLVTGQNPMSAEAVGQHLVQALAEHSTVSA